MPRLTVDGVEVTVAPGATLLEAARSAGRELPTLCDDPRLAPSGSCRLCVVEVEGQGRPVTACSTPAEEGMAVRSTSPDLERLRATLRDMHDVRPASDETPMDDSHPLIHVDLRECVSCWRCVRICEEVQGQHVWRIAGRGVDTHVVPDSGAGLGDSSCVSCGACVDTCPTDALQDRSVLELGPPERWTRTVCPYCGVGCELEVGTRGDRIVQVRPALDAPVNRGHACVKGRYGFGFNASPDRLREPLVRRDGTLRPATWEEAVAVVADGLRRTVDEHGPEAVGILGSARATNEENYLTQKLARIALGTNNVDSCARVCHAPSAVALGGVFGTGAATSCFDDIEQAATILVCGANVTENHPVVGARIKQAVLRGANLIVIDPRRTELAALADLHLQLRPGTNVALLAALAAILIADGLVDDTFIEGRVDGLPEFASAVARWTPEEAAHHCGVSPDDLRAAARLYATATPSIAFHGLGVTEHEQGTDGVTALANLALLTGNVGRPGAGVNPLRGQNNVQGAAHMGCEPGRLTGFAPLADAGDRFAAIWGAPLPTRPGLDAMEMLDAVATGQLRALWVIGWDLALTQPDTSTTEAALGALDLLVVSDLFLNETAARFASVVLPAASAFEKDGTFMNGERRVQRVRAAVPPPGQARTDSAALQAVAAALGHGERFDLDAPEEVWDEIRAVWPAGAGMTYRRLDAPGGLQWPCPDETHPGTARLHTEAFALGPRATLRAPDQIELGEEPTAELPFLLITGRELYKFNAGTMTARSGTGSLRPTDLLELSPADAHRLHLENGDIVEVASLHGVASLPVQVTGAVPAGVVFATFSDPAVGINHVTGPTRDYITHTPAYKRTAVRLTRQP